MTLPVLVLLVACGQKATSTPHLVLEPAALDVVAGESVEVLAWYEDGDGRRVVDASLSSDLEAGLQVDGSTVRPTVAGTHHLVGTADVDGEVLTAEASLGVGAGPVADLALVLTADTTVAGVPVGWTLSGTDAWGNATDTTGATVTADGGIEVGADTLTGTRAGDWTVTADLAEVTDTAPLHVDAAAATALDLALDIQEREALATVVATDAWGNVVADAPHTLSASGLATSILGDNVYFQEEGWCTVTATLDATGATDSQGPFPVDWTSPTLRVTTPDHGAWFDAPGLQEFSGTATDAGSGIASVVVNEAEATSDGDTWVAEPETGQGITVIQTVATDGVGRTRTDIRAAYSGDALPRGEVVPDGVVVRLNEGDGGLDALGEILAGNLDPAAITASLPSPLLDEEACRSVFGFEVCYALAATITGVDWADASVVLDPQADGTLVASIVLTGVEVDWEADGELAGSAFADSGTGTADTLQIDTTAAFSVVDGSVEVTLSDVSAELSGLDLGLSADVNSALTTLGLDLEGETEAALEASASALSPDLEADLESMLADLRVEDDWAVGDTIARFRAAASRVDVDADGITLAMDAVVTIDEWRIALDPPGAPYAAYGPPTWSERRAGAGMAVGADTLNQLLFASWGSGAFSMVKTADELTIDMTTFSAVLPGIEDLVVKIDLLLPPMLQPSGDGSFDCYVADFVFAMYEGEVIEGTEVYVAYITVEMDGTYTITDNQFDVSFGRATTWMDLQGAPEDVDLGFLQTSLESLTAGLYVNESRYVGNIPLPSIGSYQLAGTGVAVDGPEGGYLVVDGDLVSE